MKIKEFFFIQNLVTRSIFMIKHSNHFFYKISRIFVELFAKTNGIECGEEVGNGGGGRVEECGRQLTTSLPLTPLFTRRTWRNGFLLVMGKPTEKLISLRGRSKTQDQI